MINSISVLFPERNIRHDDLPTSLAILLLDIPGNEDRAHICSVENNRVVWVAAYRYKFNLSKTNISPSVFQAVYGGFYIYFLR